MNAEAELAEQITSAVLEVPGVKGLFPHSVVASAVGALLGNTQAPAAALVEIDPLQHPMTISTRLSIKSSVPSAEVVRATAETIGRVLGGRDHVVHVQIAHID